VESAGTSEATSFYTPWLIVC